MKLISWNIQGVEGGVKACHLDARTDVVCHTVSNEDADVVFLQEVVPGSATQIRKRLPNYRCLFGGERDYFTGMLLKKDTVSYSSHKTIPFEGSIMRRNLLTAKVKIGGKKLVLMTSHLESSRMHSQKRVSQLKSTFERILKVPENFAVIFGGDLNLEENEVDLAGRIPPTIEDVWITCGSPEDSKYTWDMTCNDNLDFPPPRKPRRRYDRIYMRSTSQTKITPTQLNLLGLERLPNEKCFPSDHWGLACQFDT